MTMALGRLRRGAALESEPDRARDDAGARAATGEELATSWRLGTGDELVPGRIVLQTLGGGTIVEALLVWDERLYAVMVAKVLRPACAGDDDALRSLRHEALALQELAHPALVRGFDTVLDGPRPHLLLEHLEGRTLRSLMRRGGPLPAEQGLPLALHLAAVAHFLAGAGWVHLDIKPDNVIMGIPPRLIDLSLARTVARAASLSGPTGTDAYMAPEQCAPDRFPGAVSGATDVFGLGATLYHALTGRRPFPRAEQARRSRDPDVRFPQLVSRAAPAADHLPPVLAALLDRMLDPEPAVRPTAGEVVEQLEPLVERLPRRLVLSRRGMRAR